MGTSENRRENGQYHSNSSNNQQLHAIAPPHMYALDARGQVFPSDWHARAHHQQQHMTDCALDLNSKPAVGAGTHDAQSMDVDQSHYDRPEVSSDDHSAPGSPSSALYERSSSSVSSNNASHTQQLPSRPLAPLHSHFATPVMRFKAAHGYVRKHDELPQVPLPASSSDSTCQSPVSASIRLPSLTYPGTPPLSPHRWPASATNSPRSSFGEAFPSPRRGFPLTASESMRQVFPSNNRAGFSSPSSSTTGAAQTPFTLAPLRRGCDSPANGPAPAKTLPSLASLASSLPDSNSSSGSRAAASPLLDHVGGPFQYERSQSCPSDEFRAFQYHPPEPTAAPLYVLKSSVPKNSLVRSYSVDGETAAALRPRSLLAPPPSGGADAHASFALTAMQQQPPRPQSTQQQHQPEPEAIQRWLEPERQSFKLNSLAESAHALQLLERSRSPSLSSSPSSPMSVPRSVSGGMSEEDESGFPADSKREKKLCSFPQCTSNAVTRGKCISHGGGRRCQRKGCTRGAQSKGLCVAHGGGRICHERGCSNIQRSMGLCIRHGGGKRCSMPGCQKGVVRQDLCTAHGGKRKCRIDDCTKHVKKRGLCRSHANSMYAPSS